MATNVDARACSVMHWTSQVEIAGAKSRNLQRYSSIQLTCEGGLSGDFFCQGRGVGWIGRVQRPPPYLCWSARVWSKEQPVKGRTPTLEGRKGMPGFCEQNISTGLHNFQRKHCGSCTREIAWESAVGGDGQTESRLIIRRGA